jgi:serine phosphatase RsbU (regulator of sigma subunit)/ligand-binding sensor domain-containing protein
MIIKKFILVIIYGCFFASAISSQTDLEKGSQLIYNYSPKEYDAQQQNWAILQNESGIMYFGNTSGLLEFDGADWRIYQMPNKSVVRSLANGKNGKIYVGAQGDLGYFLPDSSGRLTFHSLMDFVPEDAKDFSDVWNIFVSNGKVYFNVAKYILIWNIQKKEFKIVKGENSFHAMFMVNGRIYVREWRKGLEVLTADSLTLLRGGEKFADERIYVMLPFPGEEGIILIVTRTMGLFKYNGNNFIPFKTEADKFIKENLIYLPGVALSDANILLGTSNGGAVVIDSTGKEVRRYNTENGINNNTIFFTYQDRSGAIWLAMDNGISRIDYASPVTYFDTRNNFSALTNDIIRHNGILYAATSDGVYYLDPQTSIFHRLKNSNNQSWTFLESGNELLVGTFNGLFKVDKEKLSPVRKTLGNEYKVHILKQSQSNPNRIFVGANGLWSILKNKNGWTDEGPILGLTDQVTSIVEDNDGKLWMGTNASGVYRITLRKDGKGNIILDNPVIEHFETTNGLPGGLLFVNKFNGKDYFESTDKVYKFDENKKMFYFDNSDQIVSVLNYYNSKGLFFDNEDCFRRIWISAKHEVAMGTPQPDGSYKWLTAPFKRFADEQIGYIYSENNGVVWFSTASSIIKYDFTKKNSNNTDFSALVRKVEVGADSTIYFGGMLSGPIIPEITYKNNSLKFKFSATSYEGKNTNQYKTFLESFDDDWSSWSTVNTKEYTNLSPGKYTFKVTALNILGIEGSTGTYSFEILSPWYRTWWAYIFYLLVLAVGIFLVDRIQRRRLVKKARERAENERKTKELEEARKLQISMLPKHVPKLPNLDIAVYMQTATEVGGDYYDFIIDESSVLNVGFGDATGHGLQAGTMVTLMKGFFMSDAARLEPQVFMNHCSSMIKEIKLGRILMSFSLLRFNSSKLLITSAGMPPVYYYNKEKKETEEIIIQGTPLGAMKNFNYTVVEKEIKSGDTILMITDGLPELRNRNDEIFGYPRVKNHFNEVANYSPDEIIGSFVKKADAWMNGTPQADDITFIVMKVL